MKITVRGFNEARAAVQRGLDFARNPERFLRASVLYIMESSQRNFISQGRPDRWAPLSAGTIRQRGAGAQILRDKGILMASVTKADTHPQGVYKMTPTSIAVGTNVPYAEVQQTGGWRTVKAHTRRRHFRQLSAGSAGGRKLIARTAKVTLGMTVNVRSHTRYNQARPFLLLQPEDPARIMNFFRDMFGEAVAG